MATSQIPKTSTRITVDNTPELRDALVHAATLLGHDRTSAPETDNEPADRNAARMLAKFARQLGASF